MATLSQNNGMTKEEFDAVIEKYSITVLPCYHGEWIETAEGKKLCAWCKTLFTDSLKNV